MEPSRISFDFSHMLAAATGGHGIREEVFDRAAARIPALHQAMEAGREAMAWRALPYVQQDIVAACRAAAARINAEFDNFVVFGIGGSALGSKALFSACCHSHYNALPRERRGGVRFYVEDNVDPDRMNALFDVIDVKRTAFHIITKSGNTVETMSQFIIILDRLRKELGENLRNNLFITTDRKSGIMKGIADAEGWDTFTVPDGVGGRFSVLCPVGLLSAAVLNLDLDALLAGAVEMDAACSRPALVENPAYQYALLYTEAMRMGANISVMLPYADALAPFSEWYCQLWAESLGKRNDRAGHSVHCGQTPVRALGVTDQHSQIQLYNEGPFDKVISFIGVEHFHSELVIPAAPIDVRDVSYLCGHSLNELIAAEMSATVHAVTKNGKMNNTIMVESLNEASLGKLFFFFEMATAAAGELLDINAFDQPGVEEGKIATFALMGRPGYAEKAAELRAGSAADARLMLSV